MVFVCYPYSYLNSKKMAAEACDLVLVLHSSSHTAFTELAKRTPIVRERRGDKEGREGGRVGGENRRGMRGEESRRGEYEGRVRGESARGQ
jgi:hypothetical protein